MSAAAVPITRVMSFWTAVCSSYSMAGSPVSPTWGGVRPAAPAFAAVAAATAFTLSMKGPRTSKSCDAFRARTNRNSMRPSREAK